jgi:hypothetical protein
LESTWAIRWKFSKIEVIYVPLAMKYPLMNYINRIKSVIQTVFTPLTISRFFVCIAPICEVASGLAITIQNAINRDVKDD